MAKRISISMSDNEYLMIQKNYRDWVKKGLEKGVPLFRLSFSRFVLTMSGVLF